MSNSNDPIVSHVVTLPTDLHVSHDSISIEYTDDKFSSQELLGEDFKVEEHEMIPGTY